MAKFRPGIPDTFSLDVEPVTDLGDYLDEPSPRPPRRARVEATEAGEARAPAAPATPAPAARAVVPETPPIVAASPVVAPQEPVVAPAPARPEPTIALREERISPQAPKPVAPAAASPGAPEHSPPMNQDRLPKPKAPRREISMTPETLRMSDELLEAIRSGSGQRDTKANELFHALVLLVHEAMGEIDPHAIPKRGRWGTPTARAYPLELKNAFLRAVLRKYGAESAGSEPG